MRRLDLAHQPVGAWISSHRTARWMPRSRLDDPAVFNASPEGWERFELGFKALSSDARAVS
jgi:hypothetical protein